MKVAIIGAGIAGLTVARQLLKLGADVTIFEKSRGLGGRLSTRRTAWANLDLGAQYFTARSEAFQQETRRWETANTVAQWQMTPYQAAGDHLVASPDEQIRYVGVPDMNSISHFLGQDIKVERKLRITGLMRSNQLWTLQGDNGEHISGFDWVISTLPAEQAIPLLQGCGELASRLPSSIHAPCWALGLATRGKVREDIQGIFGDDMISWVSRLSSRPQRQGSEDFDDSWMLHFKPQWSAGNEHTSDTELAELGTGWLEKLLQLELETVHHESHYWRYASIDAAKDIGIDATYVDASQQLAAIGAWCCGGRVEGAYVSAMALIDDCFR